MSKGIGNIVVRLREESERTLEQLCEGICSKSHMARIEQNESVPDPFVLDRLFGRMGKSTERLEYVLSKENYELYELQYQIQKEILYQNFDEAERFLKIYEGKKKAKQPLHRQFIEQERAQMLWIRGGRREEILECVNAAISETMPLEHALEKEMALSVEELKLLLFRWEVCCGEVYERNLREVWEILDYMENRKYDAEELVKAYPYAVILLVRNYEKRAEYVLEYFLKITEKALELLRNEAKILFMAEILELYTELLQAAGEQDEKILEFREMRKSLLEVEEEFGVHYEQYPLFQHLNRTFELDYEMIRNERRASKLSQEKLCEDICTQETLSKIESGKCAPSNKNLTLLLEKMKRNRERIGMNIAADRYEIIALEKQITWAIYKADKKQQNVLIKELEEKLDLSVVKNQQYIQSEQVRVELYEGICSYEEGINKLYRILYMTLPLKDEKIFSHSLTNRECNILNQIAGQFCQYNQKEKGIVLWKQILQNYEEKGIHMAFNICNWELITGNMAGRMEEVGYIEEPMQICMERLQIALEIGKGSEIGRSLAIIACVLERKRDADCIARFRQTLTLYKLMRFEYRYKCIKEYINGKGIHIKNV